MVGPASFRSSEKSPEPTCSPKFGSLQRLFARKLLAGTVVVRTSPRTPTKTSTILPRFSSFRNVRAGPRSISPWNENTLVLEEDSSRTHCPFGRQKSPSSKIWSHFERSSNCGAMGASHSEERRVSSGSVSHQKLDFAVGAMGNKRNASARTNANRLIEGNEALTRSPPPCS